MTKLYIAILSTFLLSNTVWANSTAPIIENNSLSKAMLEINARDYRPETEPQIEISSTPFPITHESEKNNSLFRGALAKQGVDINLLINNTSKTSYSRYAPHLSEQNNSLYRGALAK